VTYSLDVDDAFTSVISGNSKLIVNNATIADHATKNYVLTASSGAFTKTAPFTVEIVDPCSQAVFQPATPSPIADLVSAALDTSL
jgi:hypothetical protein